MKNIAYQFSEQVSEKKQPAWLVRVMVEHYCLRYHCQGTLCKKCEALIQFEEERSQNCTGCAGGSSCSRQCYPVATRLQINHIIRWAEPKLRWRKPFMLVRNLLTDNVKK